MDNKQQDVAQLLNEFKTMSKDERYLATAMYTKVKDIHRFEELTLHLFIPVLSFFANEEVLNNKS